MSLLLSLHAAISERLEGDTPLMARVTAIYDGPAPTTAALPHLEIGDTTEAPGPGTFGRVSQADTVTLHLYSNARTRTEALELAQLVDNALRTPLALDGHHRARLRSEFREVLTEGKIRHVPIRYRITSFEAP